MTLPSAGMPIAPAQPLKTRDLRGDYRLLKIPMTNRWFSLACLGVVLLGCGDGEDEDVAQAAPADEDAVALTGDWDSRIAAEELARGRLDHSWQRVVQLDTAGLGSQPASTEEKWDSISAQSVNVGPMK